MYRLDPAWQYAVACGPDEAEGELYVMTDNGVSVRFPVRIKDADELAADR